MLGGIDGGGGCNSYGAEDGHERETRLFRPHCFIEAIASFGDATESAGCGLSYAMKDDVVPVNEVIDPGRSGDGQVVRLAADLDDDLRACFGINRVLIGQDGFAFGDGGAKRDAAGASGKQTGEHGLCSADLEVCHLQALAEFGYAGRLFEGSSGDLSGAAVHLVGLEAVAEVFVQLTANHLQDFDAQFAVGAEELVFGGTGLDGLLWAVAATAMALDAGADTERALVLVWSFVAEAMTGADGDAADFTKTPTCVQRRHATEDEIHGGPGTVADKAGEIHGADHTPGVVVRQAISTSQRIACALEEDETEMYWALRDSNLQRLESGFCNPGRDVSCPLA